MVTTCLASPSPADHDRARLLLRLLCCLAAANVLRPSGCTNLLEAMVDAAKGALSEGGRVYGWVGAWWKNTFCVATTHHRPWKEATQRHTCVSMQAS